MYRHLLEVNDKADYQTLSWEKIDANERVIIKRSCEVKRRLQVNDLRGLEKCLEHFGSTKRDLV